MTSFGITVVRAASLATDAVRDSTESTAAITVFDRVLEMLDVQREVGMGSIEAEQNDTEVIGNLVRLLRGA